MKCPLPLHFLAVASLVTAGIAASPYALAQQADGKTPASLRVFRLVVPEGSGEVDFVAVGWPSALRIRGQGKGLAGELSVNGTLADGVISFELDSLGTGIDLRDKHLKQQYLETAKYPRAELKLASVDVAKLPAGGSFGSKPLPFEGRLTLHGVERPVSGVAQVGRSGDRVQVSASFDLRTTDFGIAIPQYMGITVGEQVKVSVKFAGTLDGAAPNDEARGRDGRSKQ